VYPAAAVAALNPQFQVTYRRGFMRFPLEGLRVLAFVLGITFLCSNANAQLEFSWILGVPGGGFVSATADGVYEAVSGPVGVLVTKYDSNGNVLWSRQFGFESSTKASGVSAVGGGV
jgi:hypothetical protein